MTNDKSYIVLDSHLLPRYFIPGRSIAIKCGAGRVFLNFGLGPFFASLSVCVMLVLCLVLVYTGRVTADPMAVLVLWFAMLLVLAWSILVLFTFDVVYLSSRPKWIRVRRALFIRKIYVGSLVPIVAPATAWRDAPRRQNPRCGYMVFFHSDIDGVLFPICWQSSEAEAIEVFSGLCPEFDGDVVCESYTVYCRAAWVI